MYLLDVEHIKKYNSVIATVPKPMTNSISASKKWREDIASNQNELLLDSVKIDLKDTLFLLSLI